ncbi:MAG: polysaccharide deacetylase family protein [Bauldia sp.]|nr:polysaccharide deacetylase family protein [Bauldia sp.]
MKRAVQKAVLRTLGATRLHRLLAPFTAGQGAILTMHRVRPAPTAAFRPNAHLEITPEFLDHQLGWFRTKGVDVVTLDEALARLASSASGRFVVLTLDDGYRDNLEIALPLFERHRVPFTVFVATGYPDRDANPWWMTLEAAIARSGRVAWTASEPVTLPTVTTEEKQNAFNTLAARVESLPEDTQRAAMDDFAVRHGVDVAALVADAFMHWDEVRTLAASPLATIGGHTVNHPALGRLSDRRAREEVVSGADRLEEELGRRPRHFAYPYGYPGKIGERDYRLLAELGFVTAVRTTPGTLTAVSAATPTALPRISLNGYFQEPRYTDVLLSGAPFAASALKRRLSGSRRASRPAPASASSG